MKWFSRLELTEITGKAWVTIAKRLNRAKVEPQDGQYPSDRALAVIYAGDYDTGDGDVLQPQAEKARLDRLRANKVELELQIARGDVVMMSDVIESWAQVGTNIKNKLLSMPTKAAPLVLGCQSLPQVKEVLHELVREALDELSATPPGIGDTVRALPSDEATADDDGEPVGGQVPQAKPRKRGRARAVENG
jgi:phage terminase Nu1 subunit (DNA packaging protein)